MLAMKVVGTVSATKSLFKARSHSHLGDKRMLKSHSPISTFCFQEGNLIFVYCNYRQPLTVQKGSEIRHSVAGHMVEVIELWLRGASHCDLVPGCLEAKLE